MKDWIRVVIISVLAFIPIWFLVFEPNLDRLKQTPKPWAVGTK